MRVVIGSPVPREKRYSGGRGECNVNGFREGRLQPWRAAPPGKRAVAPEAAGFERARLLSRPVTLVHPIPASALEVPSAPSLHADQTRRRGSRKLQEQFMLCSR